MARRIFIHTFMFFLVACSIEKSTIRVSYNHIAKAADTTILTAPTIALTTSAFTTYSNQAIADIDPVVSGDQVSFSITPSLPAGLSLNTSTGKISGTPTQVLANTTYTLKVTNSGGEAQVTFDLLIGQHYTVNSTGDQGDQTVGDGNCSTVGNVCTIRAATEELSSGSLQGKITIPAGSYTLGSSLALTQDAIVEGAGIGSTIISGNDTVKIFDVSSSGLDLSLSNLALTHAKGNHLAGGAIRFNGATLALNNVEISNSTTTGFQGTAGLFFFGTTLTIRNSVIKNNTSTGASCSGNCAGAVRIDLGTARVYDSSFESNSTASSGGGAILSVTPLEVYRSSFKSNVSKNAGGAIFGQSTLTVKQSYFDSNRVNVAGEGGAIYNSGTLVASVFENNTFYKNQVDGASSNGGAIQLEIQALTSGYTVKVTNNTFAGNISNGGAGTAGGIGTETGGDYSFANNVFYNNTPINCKITSTVVSTGGNIDSGTSCTFGDSTDLASTNPNFTTTVPGNNGGSTPTFIFSNTSPAYNSGVSSDCPSVDQRDLPRNDGACDRGAVEI